MIGATVAVTIPTYVYEILESLAFTPGLDEMLALNTQGIGDAIDVIEEADNLCRIMDRDIIQAGFTQLNDIGLGHSRWLPGQLLSEGAERVIDRVQRGAAPVTNDGIDEGIRFRFISKVDDLGTEVMRV